MEKEIVTVPFGDTTFVLLTRPTVLLPKFFAEQRQSSGVGRARRLCRFPTDDFYAFAESPVRGFLADRFASKGAVPPSSVDDLCVECPDLSTAQLLSQMISDGNERSAILANIGAASIFPSDRILDIRAPSATFLSFFRFYTGFSVVSPPCHAHALIPGSWCAFERLGIPKILVNCNGVPIEVSAATVVNDWEPRRFQPISGPKSGHFIVVYSAGVQLSEAKTFFSQLSHVYGLLQFGKLSPFPRFDTFYQVEAENIASFIVGFFQDQNVSEYQQYPILTFIVGPPLFDPEFMPHSILSYLRVESISTASTDEIKTFAFIVYSRIRIFAPSPFGMISVAPNVIAPLFFGYRYQPPFVLRRRSGTELTIHIAWDLVSEASAWIDDVGSVLHFFPQTPIPQIRELMVDAIRSLSGISVRFTFSVLGSGISQRRLKNFRAVFRGMDVALFALTPEPTIQVMFRDTFKDDAVIFTDPEHFRLMDGGDLAQPDANCSVTAQLFPAWRASVYGQESPETAKAVLTAFVREMSQLSWLSVKPGSEARTVSIPPHIVALLRKVMPTYGAFSRYEFLPSTERI
jgi:hypothetical protein